MSTVWLWVATLLYSLGLAHAIVAALLRSNRFFRPAFRAFSAGAVVHAVSLVESGLWLGRLPVNNFYESISLCAFVIALLFMLVYWRYQFEGLGVFLFPLVFIMTLVGGLHGRASSWSSTAVREAWLLVHVVLVMAGYAALLVMAAAAVAYLIQERHLKSKQPRILIERLPALGTLDGLISRSMAIGFVLITLAVIAGSTWAFVESGTRWIREPKIVISLATWGFYLAMVFLRVSAGWRGRKAAFMAIGVVAFSALTWVAHAGLRGLLLR